MDSAPWINAAGDIMARDPRQPLLNSFAGRWPKASPQLRSERESAMDTARVADLLTIHKPAEPNLRCQDFLT
jgi:hypothetical protein